MVWQLHSIQKTFITYCLTSFFILLCVLLLVTYFKNSILRTFLFLCHVHFQHTLWTIYHLWKELKQLQPQGQHHQQSKTGNSLVQISPPPDELLTEVREQLIKPSSTEQIPSIQDLQQDSQVFETEHLLHLHTPNIFIEQTYSPLVVCND